MNRFATRNGTTLRNSRLPEISVISPSDESQLLDENQLLIDAERQQEDVRQLLADSQQETALIVQDVLQAGLEEVRAIAKLLEDAGGEMSYERTITIIDD